MWMMYYCIVCNYKNKALFNYLMIKYIMYYDDDRYMAWEKKNKKMYLNVIL